MSKYDGKEAAYYSALKFTLKDGMVDHTEFSHLADLREQLGITIERHNKMESELRAAAPPPARPLASASVKDSVISKSTIVAGDYIDGDTIIHKGDIENYAKMCIDAVRSGKLTDGVDIYNKAKEINIEEAKEIFEKKYGKEIAAAYAIAAVPLLHQVQTADTGAYGMLFTRYFTQCTVCLGNALAFDPDNLEANIMKGQAWLAFRERGNPANPHLVKEEAIERFEKALSLDPKNAEAIKGLEQAKRMSISTNDCFITTATVNHIGELDNGQTLNTLRHFRDTYMSKTPEGKKQVQWYYTNAPEIVTRLDNSENKAEIYTELYERYILPAAKAYRNQQSDSAFNLYNEGIEFALKNIKSN